MVVFVGIDVSKDKHDCFIVSSEGEVLADAFIIPNTMDTIRKCVKCHDDNDCVDIDVVKWKQIDNIRNHLGRDTLDEPCLLTRIIKALDAGDNKTASDLQIVMQDKISELVDLYITYKKNLF